MSKYLMSEKKCLIVLMGPFSAILVNLVNLGLAKLSNIVFKTFKMLERLTKSQNIV